MTARELSEQLVDELLFKTNLSFCGDERTICETDIASMIEKYEPDVVAELRLEIDELETDIKELEDKLSALGQ